MKYQAKRAEKGGGLASLFRSGRSRAPWAREKGRPTPYFVELGGDDQHFLIRDDAGDAHELGLDDVEKVADAITADPGLRRRTELGAPVVLVLPYGVMGGLERVGHLRHPARPFQGRQPLPGPVKNEAV